MKANLLLFGLLWSMLCNAHAQGTFLFDQQSSSVEVPPLLGTGPLLQSARWGQSFTPELPAIDFIRLRVGDRNPGNQTGAEIHLILRDGTVDGLIVALSEAVTLADGFLGIVHFGFPDTVPLTPGDLYIFEPVISQASDLWNMSVLEHVYSRGTAFQDGQANIGGDLWFREGIIVPEPGTLHLALISGLAVFFARRRIQ